MRGFAPGATGYFGKLPAKGDFLRAGLPESLVAPLDNWCRDCLVASRAALGEDWLEAWLNAPVWRFLLPPGACGPHAVLGVWLPSTDKVGRHFPFLLCALAPTLAELCDGAAWTQAAEAAGLACLLDDMPHEHLPERLGAPVPAAPLPPPGWWTSGSPFVKPRRMDYAVLPSAEFGSAMLRDCNRTKA